MCTEISLHAKLFVAVMTPEFLLLEMHESDVQARVAFRAAGLLAQPALPLLAAGDWLQGAEHLFCCQLLAVARQTLQESSQHVKLDRLKTSC